MGANSARSRVVVHGRVQGVWFRASAERVARASDVSGWVRNRADGSVEAVFEGAPQAVSAMLSWCEHGPEHARVDRLEVYPEQPEGLAGFSIRP